MIENSLSAHIIEHDGRAQRQYIDACSVFAGYEAAIQTKKRTAGRMVWRWHKGASYLFRMLNSKVLKEYGVQSEETEAIYKEFNKEKKEIVDRARTLKHDLSIQRQMNKILHVGRAPDSIVSSLNREAKTTGVAGTMPILDLRAMWVYEAQVGAIFILGVYDYEELFIENCLAGYIKEARIDLAKDKFSAMIVSKNGHMTMAHTISPQALSKIIRVVASHEESSQRRDKYLFLVDLLEEISNEWFPHLWYSYDELTPKP